MQHIRFGFIYKTDLMHNLQTHLKVWSFATPTCAIVRQFTRRC